MLGDGYDRLILDAGGVSGALAPFLTKATIVALNVDESGDVVYDGKAFPFSSGAFDVVVSLDTLEHVPREARAFFVSECLRTARETIIIAAPYGTPGHAMYEARLDQLQLQVTGHPHRWLHEHVVNGLPDADEILQLKQLVDAWGCETRLLYSGDYESQCGLLERSLKLSALLGPAGRLSSAYLMFASMALWHDIVFHEQPYDLANRFYLVAQRKGH